MERFIVSRQGGNFRRKVFDMKQFENGVLHFTEGKAVIPVFFPETEILCHWCRFCRAENDLKRFWCRLTNEMIYNPYSGIGSKCPIKFKEE